MLEAFGHLPARGRARWGGQDARTSRRRPAGAGPFARQVRQLLAVGLVLRVASAATLAAVALPCWGLAARSLSARGGWPAAARRTPRRPRLARGCDGSPGQRPAPKLPPNQFAPKKQLGQNYLQDPNYIARIATTFVERARALGQPGSEAAVVELGPGLGAITRQLHGTFPGMQAVELDDRAVALLRREVPGLEVLHTDMLEVDYAALAAEKGQRLSIIGNLPYNIVSDVFLSLVKHPGAVRFAFVMVQREVADKIIAVPDSKEYSWLSVLLQIYARPKKSFNLPPTVFYPRPKVTSTMVELEFLDLADLPRVDAAQLAEVVRTAFRQRKKVLKHSLRPILERQRGDLPRRVAGLRADQAEPKDFVEAARLLFPTRVGVK